MDDIQIINLFFDRSEQAIVELSQKYCTVFLRVAFNILGNAEDAEECVNDAYLGAWNAIPPARPEPLVTFVCRIVRNQALKRYQANTAEKRNSAYDVALEELEGCIPSRDSAEDSVTAGETKDAINAFLATQDRTSRVIFVRRYWYADTVEEIADALGVTRHYVSVRLSRTRKRLRAYLTGKGVQL